MKRVIALMMLCLLLSGCSFSSSKQEPVLFYYQRAEYLMGQADGAIVPEERDGAGHIRDMDYLLRLYLAGPHSEDLSSPFPSGVHLTSVRTSQNMVTVTLPGTPEGLSEAQKTLAYACMTLTCLEITPKDTVCIFWGEEIITMDRSCLTLFDSSPLPTE